MAEISLRQWNIKRMRQHYGTILFKHLNGEPVEEIATSLKMEKASVLRCLAWAEENWSRVFSTNDDARLKPKASEVAGVRQWKIETACSACGARIAADQDRLVIAALELIEENDDFTTDYRRNGVSIEQGGGVQKSIVGRRHFKHYCEECSVKEPEFLISNPAFVQREMGTATGWTPQKDSEVLETVKSDLAAGNTDSFDDAFPKNAPSKDAMAHSTGMEEVGKRSGFGSSNLRVDPQSGEAAQRERMVLFLNVPASRGMPNDQRAAARMWAEGASQNEVARKLKRDQSTVSRWIKSAQVKASAPR
jgi:Helix-turn-helix domain